MGTFFAILGFLFLCGLLSLALGKLALWVSKEKVMNIIWPFTCGTICFTCWFIIWRLAQVVDLLRHMQIR